MIALQETIRRFAIPPDPFLDLLSAFGEQERHGARRAIGHAVPRKHRSSQLAPIEYACSARRPVSSPVQPLLGLNAAMSTIGAAKLPAPVASARVVSQTALQ